MNDTLQASLGALELPDVQQAMQLLSQHGLGVFLPHIHTKRGMEPLPTGSVQLEQGLKVRFVGADDPDLEQAIPVGWVWDKTSASVVSKCFCCGPDDGCRYRGEDDLT